jgi:hypothetical protein
MRNIEITDKGTLELADGILRLRWRSGHAIGPEEAHGANAAIEALSQGRSLPLLVDVEGVTFTRPARKVPPSPSVSKIALLVSSPVDYVIALFVLRISPLPCPVAYFTSIRKAMSWLRRSSNRAKDN